MFVYLIVGIKKKEEKEKERENWRRILKSHSVLGVIATVHCCHGDTHLFIFRENSPRFFAAFLSTLPQTGKENAIVGQCQLGEGGRKREKKNGLRDAVKRRSCDASGLRFLKDANWFGDKSDVQGKKKRWSFT